MPKRSRSFVSHRRWTEAEAGAALDALDRSGLSTRAFARREGIDPQRLQRWRHRLEVGESIEPERATFVEVSHGGPATVDVVLSRGRVIRVSESIDPSVLRRLADALDDESSC